MRFFRLLRRLLYWRRLRAEETSLSDELAFHRDMIERDLLARGFSPAQARDGARRAMGNETLMRENSRAIWIWPWLGVPYAVRALRRTPEFTASVVLSLTLGIGATAAIFAVVNAVLVRPLPYGHADRLVSASIDMAPLSAMHAPLSPGAYRTFKRFARTIEGIGLYFAESVNVSDPDGRGEPQRLKSAWATASTFSLLEVSPILGRVFTDSEDAPKGPNVAMISERLWRSRFAGERSVLGRAIVISGKSTQIIGVMPADFRFPDAGTELWTPARIDLNDPYAYGFSANAIARLKPGVTIDAAEREFARVFPRIVEVTPNIAPGVPMQMILQHAKPVPRLVPMRSEIVGVVSRTLWMLAATTILVLIVTCANVANLLLVRADSRRRELSVRTALGAGRHRVLAQFFTEAAVLTGSAAVLGLGVAAIGVRQLVSAGPAQIPRLQEVHIDAAVVMFTVATAAIVVLACSAIPAIRVLRDDPLAGLRGGGRAGTAGPRHQHAREALVVAQVAFALVVLAASGLLLRSSQRLHAVRAGFDADGLATLWVSLTPERYPNDASILELYARLLEQAVRLPGVTDAALTSRLPLGSEGTNQTPFYVEGADDGNKTLPPLETYATVDGDYFKTMGIPLIAGRELDQIGRLDRIDNDQAVIGQETARVFFHDSTGRAALNKRFQSLPNGKWHTVVGVVGNIRDTSLSAAPARMVYLPATVGRDAAGQTARTIALVVRTRQDGDVTTVTRALQRTIHDIDPTLPTFNVRSMRATMDASTARLTFTTIVLAVAAAVTLILSVVGLYGVIAYIVTLRRREFGVRVALGARPSSVAMMMTKQGLRLSGAGIIIGLALVLLAARFLRALLFEVAPTDPVTLVAATTILIVSALLATWIPVRRALHANPMDALRAD